MKYARSLGSRPTDPDYCNAVERPHQTSRIGDVLCWVIAIALLAALFTSPQWWPR